ncbi:spore germination protein GerPE [Bacillus fonticola]|uniref:spore germination protein GerPE n=1 Tax=Bacillus fonticola TaxID=2728853 RepID=UPI001473FDE2|nr:spore germination protein GerPE [Bacillus fonticola]
MFERTSKVDYVHSNTLVSASVVQVGDTRTIEAHSYALAYQREAQFFNGKEGDLKQFPIFREHIPLPPVFFEQVEIQTHNPTRQLRVGKMDFTAISSAAVVHIGNVEAVYLESRVKHIRQLLTQEQSVGGIETGISKVFQRP